VVGEIPDWAPLATGFITPKEASNWNAAFVLLTVAACKAALEDAGLEIIDGVAHRTACLIGSALNGHDAYRTAVQDLESGGPNKISPYLLPNLCGNLPAGKAGMLLGFTGLSLSPQGACASGNHALGLGARLIRDGDIDFVLAGGVDTPILPEIIHGFANMNATIKLRPKDRAFEDPSQASRPFSLDRRGFVLSEGAGVVVLAAEDALRAHGLVPRAEVAGIGWTSDAFHFTRPNPDTIKTAMRNAMDDAEIQPQDMDYVNAHGTSTPQGDAAEIDCLKDVFGDGMKRILVSSNKSQLGHTLGASASIEAALTIEGMRQGLVLPTINHLPDPALDGVDVVPNQTRKHPVEWAMSNAFGFGGTNCCVVFRGV
jgi:3-oxoacyl-[acyl-carrier-protein] synthase II